MNPPLRQPLTFRDLARAFLALAGLSSVAIAHPLLDLLGRNPQFLIVHQVQGWDLVLLVLGLTLGPALVLGMLAGIAGLVSRRLGGYVLAGAATLLIAILMAPMIKGFTFVPGFVVTGASLALALVIVIKLGPNRKLFTIWNLLGLLPLLVAGLFFAQPGPRSILLPEQIEAAVPTADQTPPDPDIPVVLVVFDAFPTVSIMDEDGSIDTALCPNIDALCGDAVWYRNALSISDDTLLAVPSILTGNLPRPGQQPTKAWLPDNLFSWLAPWRNIHSLESHTQLGAVRTTALVQRWYLTLSDLWIVFLHTVLPEQYAGGLPSISHDWRGFAADGPAGDEHSGLPDRLDLFDAFLATLATGETGACHFLHALFPHTPYEFLPSGRRYSIGGQEVSGEGMQWGAWTDDPQVVVHSQQRHLAQVGQVDNLVGQIVAALKGAGIYEQALVVLTADHGMGFSAGDGRRHLGPTNRGDILPVPLLIKYPGPARGTVDERVVQTIDILPTVATVLGTEVPWSTDGRNLLDPSYAGHARARAYQAKSPWESDEWDVADILTGREASLRDKVRRFPRRDGERPLSAPVRGQALLGTRVPHDLPLISQWSLSMAGSGLRTVSGSPLDLVPAEVHGHVTGKDPFPAHLDIAVLVDGRIAAVTRPFRKSGIWSTLLPDEYLAPGDLMIGMALVDWSTKPPQLFSVAQGEISVIGQNLLLDAMFVYRKTGFYGLGSWAGEPNAWTNGIGETRVQVPVSDQPKTLELTVNGGAPQGAYVVAFANGSLIGAGPLDRFPWTGSLDLSTVRIADHLRLSFFSSTFVPAEHDTASSDTRTLGLAISRIELRDDTSAHSGENPAPPRLPGSFGRELSPGLPDGGQWTGVHEAEELDGFPATWTDGKATCVATWDRPSPPRYLFVELAGTVPGGTPLSIEINGTEVAAIDNVSGDWFGMIDLGEIVSAERFSITLTSESVMPAEEDASSAGDRPRGVALRSMTLMEEF